MSAERTIVARWRDRSGAGIQHLVQGAWARAAASAAAFLRDGRSEPLGEGAMPYGEIGASFAGR